MTKTYNSDEWDKWINAGADVYDPGLVSKRHYVNTRQCSLCGDSIEPRQLSYKLMHTNGLYWLFCKSCHDVIARRYCERQTANFKSEIRKFVDKIKGAKYEHGL